MTPWQEFYKSIRDPQWPDCDHESDFWNLPFDIRSEITTIHGYDPGEYQRQSPLSQRRFPIKTATACQLKWTWSTVYLSTGKTASCHRTNHHSFDTEMFDFHNTPVKVRDRQKMLKGQWPDQGCGYCRDIEQAGGQSDRMTNLDFPGIHAPPELDANVEATQVSPRILEVYFNNTCNLKCVYCGPQFSSLWDAENKKHGHFEKNGLIIRSDWKINPDFERNKDRLFKWMAAHGRHLTNFNILGGEPLYQPEFDQCLEHFQEFPCPDLDLQIFTNLNCRPDRLDKAIFQIRDLLDKGCIRNFTVTASLDCWGKPQEYARFPLDLSIWEQNFQRLIDHAWIKIVVGSTITPLTIHTLPDLIHRLNDWRKTRSIQHYFNSVNSPSYMFIDIFGDQFSADFQRALDLMPENDIDQIKLKKYLEGIAQQSKSKSVNCAEVIKLYTFLEEIDRRRSTRWREIFPWLEQPIMRIIQ